MVYTQCISPASGLEHALYFAMYSCNTEVSIALDKVKWIARCSLAKIWYK